MGRQCWRQVPASLSAGWQPAEEPGLPRVFTGGWVGYCGYETVRYGYLGGDRTLIVTLIP